MKALFLPILLLCFAYGQSQKLRVNETDKFTHQKRLETENRTLKSGLTSALRVYFRTVDSSVFVNLFGYGYGAEVIGDREKVIFLLDNDETVTGYSTGIQSYTIRSHDNLFDHQYRLNVDDLRMLAEHKVKSIRKYATSTYHDFEIPNRNQEDVKELASLILKNL